MITENTSTLKINKLSKKQYEREYNAGNIDPMSFYLVPDDEGSSFGSKDFPIELLLENWVLDENTNTYTQTVSVLGLEEDSNPIIVLGSTEDEALDAYNCLTSDVVVADNTITFTAKELPTVTFTVIAKGSGGSSSGGAVDEELVAKVDELESDVATIDGKVDTLETKTATIETDVNNLETNVATIDEKVDANTADIATNTSAISQLNNAILTDISPFVYGGGMNPDADFNDFTKEGWYVNGGTQNQKNAPVNPDNGILLVVKGKQIWFSGYQYGEIYTRRILSGGGWSPWELFATVAGTANLNTVTESAEIVKTSTNPTGFPSGLGGNACHVLQMGNGQYRAQLAFGFGSDKIAIRRKYGGDTWSDWKYFFTSDKLSTLTPGTFTPPTPPAGTLSTVSMKDIYVVKNNVTGLCTVTGIIVMSGKIDAGSQVHCGTIDFKPVMYAHTMCAVFQNDGLSSMCASGYNLVDVGIGLNGGIYLAMPFTKASGTAPNYVPFHFAFYTA